MTYRPCLPLVPYLRRHMSNTQTGTTSTPSGKTKNTVAEARNRAMRERFLRVDHAGEVGADRIYAGQMAVLGIVKDRTNPVWNYFKKLNYRSFERGPFDQGYVGRREGAPEKIWWITTQISNQTYGHASSLERCRLPFGCW